jgi:hypothetical protein
MMKRASRILAILLFVAEYGWSAPAAGRPIHSVHSNGAARKKLPKSFDLKLSMQEKWPSNVLYSRELLLFFSDR